MVTLLSVALYGLAAVASLPVLLHVAVGILIVRGHLKGYHSLREYYSKKKNILSENYQTPENVKKLWNFGAGKFYKDSVINQIREGACGSGSILTAVNAAITEFAEEISTRYPEYKKEEVTKTLRDKWLFQQKLKPFGLKPLAKHMSDDRNLVGKDSFKPFAAVEPIEGSDMTLKNFEELLESISTGDGGRVRIISNFLRGPLFFGEFGYYKKTFKGLGGHFSPIVSYDKESRLVLVMDVNHKYGAWVVPVERMLEATKTQFLLNGEWRGLLKCEMNSVECIKHHLDALRNP